MNLDLLLIGLSLVVGVPVVRAVIRARRTAYDVESPPFVWDRTGGMWQRNPDGTYSLVAENPDGSMRNWPLRRVQEVWGPISFVEPQPVESGEDDES